MAARSRAKQKLSDKDIAQAEEDRKNAPAEDVTTFEEDDDPTKFAGDFVDDEEGDDK